MAVAAAALHPENSFPLDFSEMEELVCIIT